MNAITQNNLKLDLDTFYDKESNKIDVYSSVYWTAESEKEYVEKEKLIEDYKKETPLFTLIAWCDISGYNYWVVQEEEENYVSIDVILKKDVKTYSEQEIKLIKDAVIEADDYFQTVLL